MDPVWCSVFNGISNFLLAGLFWFYGMSTIIGYLTPNPFLFKQIVQVQTIQFSMNTQFVKNISISSYSV